MSTTSDLAGLVTAISERLQHYRISPKRAAELAVELEMFREILTEHRTAIAFEDEPSGFLAAHDGGTGTIVGHRK